MTKIENLKHGFFKIIDNGDVVGFLQRDYKSANKFSCFDENGTKISPKTYQKEEAIEIVKSNFLNS